MPAEKREKIIKNIYADYSDFGPILASEELWKWGQSCKEAIRQIMIVEGLHKPKTKPAEDPHLSRERIKHMG